MTEQHVILSVLFFQEHGFWVAQSLERNIAAQGRTFDAARIAFERTVHGHLLLDAKANREPLSTLQPAPQHFWEVWKRLSVQKEWRQLDQDASQPSGLPPAYLIEAITHESLPF